MVSVLVIQGLHVKPWNKEIEIRSLNMVILFLLNGSFIVNAKLSHHIFGSHFLGPRAEVSWFGRSLARVVTEPMREDVGTVVIVDYGSSLHHIHAPVSWRLNILG